jgi:hypothetical protein
MQPERRQLASAQRMIAREENPQQYNLLIAREADGVDASIASLSVSQHHPTCSACESALRSFVRSTYPHNSQIGSPDPPHVLLNLDRHTFTDVFRIAQKATRLFPYSISQQVLFPWKSGTLNRHQLT